MQALKKNMPETGSLVATNLACKRGGRLVFEGLSFSIKAGELLYLKGANGSGKTTLLRLLAGFLTPQQGAMEYAGEAVDAADVSGTGSFIYSGHQHGLKPVLTLRENSEAYYQLMMGVALPEENLQKAATAFGLTSLIDQPLRFFSSGQTHRCALLRFALLDRPVWLMDEPTVGLDSANRERLRTLMEMHLKAGGMIVAASHDPIEIDGQILEMETFTPTTSEEDYWL